MNSGIYIANKKFPAFSASRANVDIVHQAASRGTKNKDNFNLPQGPRFPQPLQRGWFTKDPCWTGLGGATLSIFFGKGDETKSMGCCQINFLLWGLLWRMTMMFYLLGAELGLLANTKGLLVAPLPKKVRVRKAFLHKCLELGYGTSGHKALNTPLKQGPFTGRSNYRVLIPSTSRINERISRIIWNTFLRVF